VAELQQDIRDTDASHASMSQYQPVEEVLARVFAHEPLLWVRVRTFQMVTMRLLAEAVLCRLPHYVAHPGELRAEIKVPGDVTASSSAATVRVYICAANAGARQLAEEVALAGAGAVASVTEVDDWSVGQDQDATGTCLLLYLTQQIFAGPGGVDPLHITRAIDAGCTLMLVHEQAGNPAHISFQQLMEQTSAALKATPYTLYNTPAIPLYPTPEHRRASVLSVLREMLAAKHSAQGSRRLRRLASWATESTALWLSVRFASWGIRPAKREEGWIIGGGDGGYFP
jgi:hypothetical protein